MKETVTVEIPVRTAEVFAYGYRHADEPAVSRSMEARREIIDLVKDALAKR